MSSEKFCLKWNDFESNISGSFKELRDDQEFFDVTLACHDEQIKAHKVIISACSPFFRNVLRTNPHHHPLLYMRGVSFSDLRSVLDFMYHGEVNIAQEDLNNFLSVAEDLKVKGLTQNKSGTSTSGRTKPQPPDREMKRSMPKPSTPPAPEDDDIQEVLPVKTEPQSGQQDLYQQGSHHDPGQLQQFEESAMEYGESYEDYGQYEESGNPTELLEGAGTVDTGKGRNYSLEEACEKGLTKLGHGIAQCLVCHKTWPSYSKAMQHFEAKHFESEGYQCEICYTLCKTKHALECHMSKKHRFQR